MKSMQYILFVLSLVMATSVSAQKVAESQIQLGKKTIAMGADNQVMIGMDITVPADMQVGTNHVLVLTPILESKSGTDVKSLPAVYVYGRTRQLVDERNGNLPEGAFAVVNRTKDEDQTINYTTRVPYESWMHGSDLKLLGELYGCANCSKGDDMAYVSPVLLERYVVKPAIAFVAPQVEAVKTRSKEDRAYLDFPVNKTVIYPEYRRNPEELASIKRSIDVVYNDKDTEITGISIHGYASPEGSFANNTRLAIGRSEALKNYVKKQYALHDSLFTVNYTTEDWVGLRNYVEKSQFALKDEILAIIDKEEKDMDAKEYRIKALDANTYAALLRDCYPALRHSDYVVTYVVRAYTDVYEIEKILKKSPQLLSLEEMFRLSQTYEKGSDAFNEVFDIAVRMFPEDPTANINAAAMELQRGNLQQAYRYLQRADQNVAATQNNYGVYYMLQGDLNEADKYFNKAKELGAAEAAINMDESNKKRQDNIAFGDE